MENFFKSVKEDGLGLEWPKMTGDFWEYKNGKVDAYWTGYFSTDPIFKREVVAYSDLVNTYQLLGNFLSFIGESNEFDLDLQSSLMETLSIMQHHDAITGTHTNP